VLANQMYRRILLIASHTASNPGWMGFENRTVSASDAGETKLLVRRDSIEVRIEANFVMRGTVRPVRRASLTRTARDALQSDLEIPVVSLEDM